MNQSKTGSIAPKKILQKSSNFKNHSSFNIRKLSSQNDPSEEQSDDGVLSRGS